MMGKLLKFVMFLAIVAGVAVTGFAYFGDLSPQQTDTREPVILQVD